MTLTNLSLFSGAGGLDLGARLVGGFKTVAYVEFDRYAQGVLMSRMRSGDLDDAPIFEDVRTFDGRSLRGRIDVVSGGFPCQDLSFAGRRAGIEGSRSGLWKEYARIVGEVRPRFVLVENVPGLLADGALGVVLGDLAEMGFDARWCVFSAADVGANHKRERVWVVAYPKSIGGGEAIWREPAGAKSIVGGETVANSKGAQNNGICVEETRTDIGAGGSWDSPRPGLSGDGWWSIEPNVGRVANGVASRVDRLRLCGNGVVPQQAAPAWQKIKDLAGLE